MKNLLPRLLRLYSVLLVVAVFAPLVIVLLVSLNPADILYLPDLKEGLTLRWWGRMVDNQSFVNAFLHSVSLAAVVTPIALVVGATAAYATVRFSFPGREFLRTFLMAPVVVPTVITGLALLQLLASFRLNGSMPGLVGGHLVICLPYSFRILAASLTGIDRDLELAARNLGARWARVQYHITLPLLLPGLAAAAAFTFLTSFDNVIISLFLIPNTFVTLPVQIFSYIQDQNDPLVAAVSSALMLLSFGFVTILERLFGIGRLLSSQ